MGLDAQGIWQYTETETRSPFSTVLNRLAASVSTQLGLIRAQQPSARAYILSAAGTLAGGDWRTVTFDTRNETRGTTPPTLTSNGLVTPAAGLYEAAAVVSIAVGADWALRIVDLTTAGSPIVLAQNPISTPGASLTQTIIMPPRPLAASRHVRVQLYSGTDKTLTTDQPTRPCYMVLRRVEA